jgi:cobalt-zinc-cadmium efflux system outer membrane protein
MPRHHALWWLVVALTFGVPVGRAWGQGPTFDTGMSAKPGGSANTLGLMPGTGGNVLGDQPGSGGSLINPAPDNGAPISGRVGATGPRVTNTQTNPAAAGPADQPSGFAAPQPIANFATPSYGSYALPSGPADEGPPDGLTLDQSVERMLQNNIDLHSKFYEITQAEADILTAGLRANPVFYADGQLVPYGRYSKSRPGGQTQYDVNISYPFDLSRKRQARTLYATRAKRVIEAQYQNAVRGNVDLLYAAYLNVLAARQAVYYARASVEGLNKLYNVTNELYRRDQATIADVKRVQVTLNTAEIGLDDARESLRKAKLDLGTLLNIPADQVESLDLRGSIVDTAPPPPPVEELERMALALRPDVVSYRLGVSSAEANVRLQLANRFPDVYALYQPYTLQDNTPFGLKSPTSWALGVTVPLPVYNRNQGAIARAKLNVTQSQLELQRMERQASTEVRQALHEYEVTTRIIKRIHDKLEPAARLVRDATYRLYAGGVNNRIDYLNAQREYQDIVKQYLDTLIRHRRSMLALNTVVGQRILP